MSAEIGLLTALHERLNGDDSHGQALTVEGKQIPVYTGEAPVDEGAPYVTLERPRTRSSETIDAQPQHEVRQQIRVHTAYDSGRGDYFLGYKIAGAIHELLRAEDIAFARSLTSLSASGQTLTYDYDREEPHLPEPNRQPIPAYDQGPKSAYDISIRYTVYL